MDNAKKLKKGDILYKEGDLPQTVYLIQSGKIGLMHERSGKRLEVTSLGASQVLGENGLLSTARHPFTAEALQESKYLEVPIELMKQQFEKSPPGIKLLVKSLVEEVRQARQQMKMSKMEGEKSPCPQASIHRVFTMMHLIARHIGKRESQLKEEAKKEFARREEPVKDDAKNVGAQVDPLIVSWTAYKLYATRFFGESGQRLRHLMDLLLKLKMAELKIAKNEEGEEELAEVRLLDIQACEDFAEFYQYHLFKGSRAEAIYVDPLALKVARAIYEISALAEIDHKGASKLDYAVVLAECKSKYGIDLKNTHLDVLERKGLFVTRQSFDDGRVVLAFDRPEFGKMAKFWGIIHEIDKWNEKGFVDLNEKDEPSAVAGHACPQCQTPFDDKAKFCGNCGAKLAAA